MKRKSQRPTKTTTKAPGWPISRAHHSKPFLKPPQNTPSHPLFHQAIRTRIVIPRGNCSCTPPGEQHRSRSLTLLRFSTPNITNLPPKTVWKACQKAHCRYHGVPRKRLQDRTAKRPSHMIYNTPRKHHHQTSEHTRVIQHLPAQITPIPITRCTTHPPSTQYKVASALLARFAPPTATATPPSALHDRINAHHQTIHRRRFTCPGGANTTRVI